jgi:hypothetical protein
MSLIAVSLHYNQLPLQSQRFYTNNLQTRETASQTLNVQFTHNLKSAHTSTLLRTGFLHTHTQLTLREAASSRAKLRRKFTVLGHQRSAQSHRHKSRVQSRSALTRDQSNHPDQESCVWVSMFVSEWTQREKLLLLSVVYAIAARMTQLARAQHTLVRKGNVRDI